MLNRWQNAGDAGKRNIFLICRRNRRLAHKGDISGYAQIEVFRPVQWKSIALRIGYRLVAEARQTEPFCYRNTKCFH